MCYAASNNDNDTKASQKEQTNIFVLIPICSDILALSELLAEGVSNTCYDSTILKMKSSTSYCSYYLSRQKTGYYNEKVFQVKGKKCSNRNKENLLKVGESMFDCVN